jgi:hypothetical protein
MDIRSNIQIKNKFKTPEGRYTLLSEKLYGTLPFDYQRRTKIILARLDASSEDPGPWIVYNIGDFLHICKQDTTKRVSSIRATEEYCLFITC